MCWDYCSMLFKDRKKKSIVRMMCTDDVCVSWLPSSLNLFINHRSAPIYFSINFTLRCHFSSPDVNLHATTIDTCWRNRCIERTIFSIDWRFAFRCFFSSHSTIHTDATSLKFKFSLHSILVGKRIFDDSASRRWQIFSQSKALVLVRNNNRL